MKLIKINLIIVFFLFCGCSVATQEPIKIEEPKASSMVIKTEDSGNYTKPQTETQGEYLYPDATRGYIENQAWPYVPKVWLLTSNGKKALLQGLQSAPGEITEVSLPPGSHTLIIERWRYFRHYGGWKQVGVSEKVELQLELSHRKWGAYQKSQYTWRIVIRSNRTYVRD